MGERREKDAAGRWSGMAALRQHPRTHRLDSSGGTSRAIAAAAAAATSSSELCRVSLGNQLNLDRKRNWIR